MKKSFRDDFHSAWNRISSGKPFAHARYADGEVALMVGRGVGPGSQATDIDNWQAPNKLTKIGVDLRESLKHTEKDYYYAISCDTSSTEDKNFLLSNIPQDREFITFANLWINGNYNLFLDKIKLHKRPTVIIGNISGENATFPFDIEEYVSFGNSCVETWEKHSDEIKEMLSDGFSKTEGRTFFVSVGPMSEVIISHLWKINPRNQYVDIGSALDEYIHRRKTRPYMIDGTFYNRQICEMEL